VYWSSMQTPDLLKLIWSKIERPHSMCPDIEIGYVRRILGEAMAAEIKDLGIISEEPYRWVLGQLLVSPMAEPSLVEEWYETNRTHKDRIQPPNDNYEDEAYQQAIAAQDKAEDQENAQRAKEVSEALEYLKERGLVSSIEGRGYPMYFVDLTTYRMFERSSV
jgi:hypothetical protein